MRITRSRFARVSLFLFIALMARNWGPSLPVSAQDKSDAVKGAAIFKIPDGYMRVPLSDFRGALLLDPKKPAGMFVTYPDDNETTAALRQRVLKKIAPMFIHDEKEKAETAITWETKAMPSHTGDGDGKAEAKLYSGAKQELQVVIYERTIGPVPFIYGYFAMRHKSPKSDDGKFLDEQGQGVKAFDKLWQSFPN